MRILTLVRLQHWKLFEPDSETHLELDLYVLRVSRICHDGRRIGVDGDPHPRLPLRSTGLTLRATLQRRVTADLVFTAGVSAQSWPRPTPAALLNRETPEKPVKNIVRSERLKMLLFVTDSEFAHFLEICDDCFLRHCRSLRARQGTVAALVRGGSWEMGQP